MGTKQCAVGDLVKVEAVVEVDEVFGPLKVRMDRGDTESAAEPAGWGASSEMGPPHHFDVWVWAQSSVQW